MGTLTFSLPTAPLRPEPLTFSVLREGDTRERFIIRNGFQIQFDEDTGDNLVYTLKITDANGLPSSQKFTLGCVRPPDCDQGPILLSIVSFSATGIVYTFHGSNVNQIRRNIIQNGVIIDTAVDVPTSATVSSNFSTTLSNGQYTLQIEGESCYSETPQGLTFLITDSGSELDWWPNYPLATYNADEGAFRINLAINRAGEYPYSIKDSSDVVLHSGVWTFAPGEIFWIGGFTPDDYEVSVGPLTETVYIVDIPAECDEGPELLEVTSISPTQTTFRFHGINVFVIEWFIRNTSDVVEHTGTVEPGGAVVTINHPALSGGTHNLLIKGASCTSETGVVDNLDFSVSVGSVSITSIVVSRSETDGRYRLNINFTGGIPNYTITVRGTANNTIATFPNTTGSPATVLLPAGTLPQTVKVMVMDVQNSFDEETAVILAAGTPSLFYVQSDSFGGPIAKTPMSADDLTFFIGSATNFNWDIEFNLPNGGQWDYIEKKLRKYVSGTPQIRDIAAATQQPANYSVSGSSNAERLWMPRTPNVITIDSQNVFKTANKWEVTFIARRGGAAGTIVGQITRTFTVSAPPTDSGIYLYNRSGGTLGSLIGQLHSTGDSLPKPTPHFDFAFQDMNGTVFYGAAIYLRQKVGSSYTTRASNNEYWAGGKTTLTTSDFTLFKGQDPTNPVFAPIFAQEPGSWQVEVQVWNAANTQVLGTRVAYFDFTVSTTSFSNPGFQRSTASGVEGMRIDGIDFGVKQLSSGNWQLSHPANRTSLNGQNTCYPWVYLNHVRFDATELAAFRSGSGLAFPPGKHTVSIKWHSNAVHNYDDVIDGGDAGNAYWLAGEQLDISAGYSNMDDYFTFVVLE